MDGSDENCTLDDDNTEDSSAVAALSTPATVPDTFIETSVIEAPEPSSGDRESVKEEAEATPVQVPVEVNVAGTIPIEDLGPKIEPFGEYTSTDAVSPIVFVTMEDEVEETSPTVGTEDETSQPTTTTEETTTSTTSTSTTRATEEPLTEPTEPSTTSLPPTEVDTESPALTETEPLPPEVPLSSPLPESSSEPSYPPTEPFSELPPPPLPVEVTSETYIAPPDPVIEPETTPSPFIPEAALSVQLIPITAPIPPLAPVTEPPKIVPALPQTSRPLVPVSESVPREELSNIEPVAGIVPTEEPTTIPPWLKKQVQMPIPLSQSYTRRIISSQSPSSTVYPLQAILNPFPPLPPTLPPEQRHEYTLQPINATVHSGLPFFLARLFMPPTQRPTRSDPPEPVKVKKVLPIVPVNNEPLGNSSSSSYRSSSRWPLSTTEKSL